jgi:hypothetical protein
MSSQETIPDDTLYQVHIDVARLAAITDYIRSIKTVQCSEMMPFIQLQNQQNQQNQHLQASNPVIKKRMSSPANARHARQEGQPHTSTLVRLSSLPYASTGTEKSCRAAV